MAEVWVRAPAPPSGGVLRVTHGETSVAVFDVAGELVALDDRCLHKGGSLSQGLVHDGTVTCPEHFWRYELSTGRRVGAPWLCLRRYEVVRDGDAIRVAVPQAAPATSVHELLLRHAREWDRER